MNTFTLATGRQVEKNATYCVAVKTRGLMLVVGKQLEENLSSYSDEELISEIRYYYPELLEE